MVLPAYRPKAHLLRGNRSKAHHRPPKPPAAAVQAAAAAVAGAGGAPFLGQEQFELMLLLLSLLAYAAVWLATLRARPDKAGGDGADGGRPARDELVYAKLRNRYLGVYALATFGDWIQGGYLYALYAEYGYSMGGIAALFVVGYGAAATVGTYVGAVGDVHGHRTNCMAYGVLYALSCVLCNSGDAGALAAGRLLGGVAYSILYTSFESWLIAEADAVGLPRSLLSRLFSVATFTNASSAVLAGVAGHVAVELLPRQRAAEGAAPVGPNKFAAAFNLAAVVLAAAAVLACRNWTERYGDRETSAGSSLLRSWRSIRASRELMALGIFSSFYEASLYVFVFMWTPSLEKRAAAVGYAMGHGLVFSIFMLCKMTGSQVYSGIAHFVSPAACLQVVFGVSMVLMAAPIFTSSYEILLLAFCGFEALLGVYWPSVAVLRSAEISDAERSTTMAVFRLPLNVLVVVVLLLVPLLREEFVFGLAVAMLGVCLACVLSIQRGAYTADYEAASVPLKPLNGGGDGSLTGSRRGSEGSLAAKEAEAGEVLPTPSPPDERLDG